MSRSSRDSSPGFDDEVTVAVRGELTDGFASALHAAARSPEQAEAWEQLETLARASGRTDDAAAVYRAVLERPYPPAIALRIAERAVAFHDEWVGDGDAMLQLLSRVTEIDPTVAWAFERLSLRLTRAARWDDLLALYDRALAAQLPPERRASLLTEAAHVAKDSAGQPDRAIRYLEQLFALRASDAQIASALERLLKQQHRYRDLIDVWTARLPFLPEDERQALRARIATSWLQHLHDPAGALEAALPLLDDPGSVDAACQLLGRIVASPTSEDAVRRRALGLLTERYDAAGKWAEVVRALETMLSFVAPEDRAAVHRDVAERLLAHGETASARDHVAALVVLDEAAFDDATLDRLLAGGAPWKIGGATLELDGAAARLLVHQAAELANGELARPGRALALLRAVVRAIPDDGAAIAALSALYEAAGEREQLLALRRHELSLAGDPARRVGLRLELARLLADPPAVEDRIAILRENLAEARGHRATIDALATVLREADDVAELERTLAGEAEALEAEGDLDAADLWARAADVAEKDLGDEALAIARLDRVVKLRADVASFDSLARLHAKRGDHATAASWLEKRLAATEGDRTPTVLALARSLGLAGRRSRAKAVLEEGLARDPKSVELLASLADLLRAAGAHQELATALVRGVAAIDDTAAIVTFSREAAEVLHHRLGQPSVAVDVLRRANAVAPDDRRIRHALADALRAAHALDEAEAIASRLVAEWGKRRPPERAAVHYLLARIHHARRDDDAAIAELETGADMDLSHAGIQKMLGELYLERGRLDRADGAFNALLLIVSRRADGGSASELGRADTLFELSRVAELRGAAARAQENLESAFEAAEASEVEALRLERALRDAGAADLLLRALETRLAKTTDKHARAEIFASIADVLQADQASAALNALLQGVVERPGWAALHERAIALAERSGLLARYADRVRTLAERAHEAGDAVAAELFAFLGRAREAEGAIDDALGAYRRAEELGGSTKDVVEALARIARKKGDRAVEIEALRRLDVPDAEQLYRLAELELSDAASRERGLSTLERANEVEPDAARSLAMLRDVEPIDDAIAAALITHARATNDEASLLDALVRAVRASPTAELLSEAHALAERFGDRERAVAVLRLAVEHDPEGASSLWAIRLLADEARHRGDAAEAVRWMHAAARVAPHEEAREIALRAAEIEAEDLGRLDDAIATYERLREVDPADATLWRPLLAALRRTGDHARLDRTLASIVDATYDPAERNELRLERAKLLLDGGRRAEGIEVLRAALEDDPDHDGAAGLLESALEAEGKVDDLADLLVRRVDAARDRGDAPAVGALSLRLAATLAPSRRADAADALRAARSIAPRDPAVLRALVELVDADEERANAIEELLAHESGSSAVELALRLAELRASLSDAAGVERALVRAHADAPGDPRVRERFAKAIDDLLVDVDDRDPSDATAALRHAAAIARERLDDVVRAAELLERARAKAPNDPEIALDLARTSLDAGAPEKAIAELDALLREHPERAARPDAKRSRADALLAVGRHADALALVDDLARDAFESRDVDALLVRARERAEQDGDVASERSLALRIAERRRATGDREAARIAFERFLRRHPDDVAILRERLHDDDALGRTTDVADGWRRITEEETGPAQVEAALSFADACAALGDPEAARSTLERVLEQNPWSDSLRERLRRAYEAIGAHREIALLFVAEARHAQDPTRRFEALRAAGRVRLVDMREPATAIGPLAEALSLRPNDPDATLLLVDAYVAAGFVDEAAQLLTEAMRRHGNRRTRELGVLQHRMARLARTVKDAATELAWLNAALEAYPQNGEVAAELAERALALGDDETANKALRAVTMLRGPCPMSRATAYALQARVAMRQGDPRKAVFLARKAQSEEEGHDEARRILEELGT